MARGRMVMRGSTILYFVGDKEVSKAEYDAAFPSKLASLLEGDGEMLAGGTKTCWPMRSEALACHPNQIPAIMERDRKHGVPTRRDKVGRPILTSRGHRRALMRLEKMHDKHGGYGD